MAKKEIEFLKEKAKKFYLNALSLFKRNNTNPDGKIHQKRLCYN
jgi:hypothetical protein